MTIERITAERIARHNPCWKRPSGEIDMGPLEALCGPDGLTPLELIERVGNEYGGYKFNAATCVWVLTRPGLLPEEVLTAAMVRIVDRAIRRVLPLCVNAQFWAWSDEDRTTESAAEVSAREAVARAEASLVAMAWAASEMVAMAWAVQAAMWAERASSAEAPWTARAARAERRLQVADFRDEIEKFESEGDEL